MARYLYWDRCCVDRLVVDDADHACRGALDSTAPASAYRAGAHTYEGASVEPGVASWLRCGDDRGWEGWIALLTADRKESMAHVEVDGLALAAVQVGERGYHCPSFVEGVSSLCSSLPPCQNSGFRLRSLSPTSSYHSSPLEDQRHPSGQLTVYLPPIATRHFVVSKASGQWSNDENSYVWYTACVARSRAICSLVLGLEHKRQQHQKELPRFECTNSV